MSDDGPGNMKGRSAHSLLTDDSIAAWIADNGPNGEENLRSALELGRIGGARARYVENWFRRRDAAAEQSRQARELEYSERSVAAAESQATSAKSSLRFAILAIVVTLVGLVVAALTYVLPRSA
ncbi:hypothetical protein FHT39_000323 [Mitsuaria sp. BK045]|uniref:hypothetical protein n=1 Tax=unclassified Roseateles TaxID=2626991 RepID=UPI00161B55B3|nr:MULTISPECIES: hypothetical protein [unclassified Roseateles]MBB3291684.1 hypothetical protein [Mitsuaria sp. BK041]MBB3360901.1 hypothetical protein [Mitsuaria sp. BK045]